MKNYYQILGLEPKASVDEIKKAFRVLAKQYHPDISPKHGEKFKEIVEAYQVLSDKDKKAEYDDQRNPRQPKKNKDADSYYRQRAKESDWMKELFGRVNRKHPFDDYYSSQQESTSITLSIEQAYTGGVFHVDGIDITTIPVSIRPKTMPGTKVKVSSKRGEIEIEIKVADSTQFRLAGNNIETSVTIDLKTAIMGGEVRVKDPAKESYILKIPAGTQSGTTFNLAKLGLGGNDIRVKIDIKIPKCSNETELENFKKEVGSYVCCSKETSDV